MNATKNDFHVVCIFEGTNRVCSKIGGGFRNVHWGNIEERVPALIEDYDQLSEGQRESVEQTFGECLGIGVEMDGAIDLFEVIAHEAGRDDLEPAFFYHSDHLGSAAYLTNDAGQVTQTLNYLPYGEDWVDIQNYAETRYPRLGIYSYNGKEKDYESGFHYYGARYYWSEVLTGWLSVDPMLDKYPSISPYNYCTWNPIRLVDPDGKGPGDRILLAKEFLGKPYKQEYDDPKSGYLRTQNTEAALAYMDCSELVCRVMAGDGITQNVESHCTSDLVDNIFSNQNQYEVSETPIAGDIVAWKGHTGIIESYDDETKNVTVVHATNYTKRNGEKVSAVVREQYPLDYYKKKGAKYYHPKVETPDVLEKTYMGQPLEPVIVKPNDSEE